METIPNWGLIAVRLFACWLIVTLRTAFLQGANPPR